MARDCLFLSQADTEVEADACFFILSLTLVMSKSVHLKEESLESVH